MNEKVLRTLEYNKIIAQLAEHAGLIEQGLGKGGLPRVHVG